MFSDTVYYPHALEIQLLFMRALFENLIRDPCTRKPSKRGKINENINSNNELQEENTHTEKRKKERKKRKNSQPSPTNVTHVYHVFFSAKKKERQSSHDKRTRWNTSTRTHQRCNNNYKTISHFKLVHSKFAIWPCTEYAVGEWESAIFVSFRKMIPFSVIPMNARTRAHMHIG